ncbi:hypothetical protein ABUE34_07130 [Kozakia baliensis]|uniref:hypothetical protein n=1 Tax=Kozakia baliensis TaxID=153496 RepID=UPI00345C2DF5
MSTLTNKADRFANAIGAPRFMPVAKIRAFQPDAEGGPNEANCAGITTQLK